MFCTVSVTYVISALSLFSFWSLVEICVMLTYALKISVNKMATMTSAINISMSVNAFFLMVIYE